jgi:hypothetical protein
MNHGHAEATARRFTVRVRHIQSEAAGAILGASAGNFYDGRLRFTLEFSRIV